MKTLLPKMADAEIWVFAAPLYVDGMPGPMKNLLDRLMPLLEPDIVLCDDHCRHPLRKGTKPGKIALISSCGFWEMDNFDSLVVHMELFGKNFRRELAGTLLRPHAGVLKPMTDAGVPIQDILDAAGEAGRQLVQDGEISRETQDAVSRPLLPCEVYLQEAAKGRERMKGAHEH
jgi:multimeric flavodoxin WrbA